MTAREKAAAVIAAVWLACGWAALRLTRTDTLAPVDAPEPAHTEVWVAAQDAPWAVEFTADAEMALCFYDGLSPKAGDLS